jgi:hypothetical protein
MVKIIGKVIVIVKVIIKVIVKMDVIVKTRASVNPVQLT